MLQQRQPLALYGLKMEMIRCRCSAVSPVVKERHPLHGMCQPQHIGEAPDVAPGGYHLRRMLRGRDGEMHREDGEGIHKYLIRHAAQRGIKAAGHQHHLLLGPVLPAKEAGTGGNGGGIDFGSRGAHPRGIVLQGVFADAARRGHLHFSRFNLFKRLISGRGLRPRGKLTTISVISQSFFAIIC